MRNPAQTMREHRIGLVISFSPYDRRRGRNFTPLSRSMGRSSSANASDAGNFLPFAERYLSISELMWIDFSGRESPFFTAVVSFGGQKDSRKTSSGFSFGRG